jgi:hypothetical protein
MPFNSREYEWSDLSVAAGNRDITGIRGINYKDSIEAEPLYAKGRYPHSIQTGNIAYDGEITLLQSEYEALVEAGGGSVTKLRNLTVVVSYGNPSNGDAVITDILTGVQITEASKQLNQNDKFMEIKLPFLATGLKNQAQ